MPRFLSAYGWFFAVFALALASTLIIAADFVAPACPRREPSRQQLLPEWRGGASDVNRANAWVLNISASRSC